jgi:tetratricopeptide (TPR) repeat protein
MALIAVCVLIAGLMPAAANAADLPDRVRDLTLEGMDLAYHCNYSGAHSRLDAAIAIAPSHPRPWVGKAEIAFWNYILGRKDSLYKVFLSAADHAIDVGEKALEADGKDPEVLTCLGTVYGYRAFAHGRAKSYLKAAWDGRKSYDFLAEAARLSPTAYDADLGLGIFHYVTAFLPKTFRYIVSILGITGDPGQGIHEMQIARQKSTFSKSEATYYLSQLAPWSTGDFAESESLIGELKKHYPENPLFEFSLAVLDIRKNDIATAKPRLQNVLREADHSMDGLKDYATYKLAECYYRSDSLARARLVYEEFLRNYDGDTYIATAEYRIGVSWEMSGNRERAMKYYRQASEADRAFGDDRLSVRRSRRGMNAPMRRSDSLLVFAENALYSRRYDRARQLFAELASAPDAPSEIVRRAEYGSAEVLYETGKYAEAREVFRHISGEDVAGEEWLLPWSHYHSGKCSVRLGDKATALTDFEQVLKYDDYDFENWLGFRTEREIQNLKGEQGTR